MTIMKRWVTSSIRRIPSEKMTYTIISIFKGDKTIKMHYQIKRTRTQKENLQIY